MGCGTERPKGGGGCCADPGENTRKPSMWRHAQPRLVDDIRGHRNRTESIARFSGERHLLRDCCTMCRGTRCCELLRRARRATPRNTC
mmetsp:Transcript_69873/g.193421  ORF Transcript_69873/g.193421 Transcript_69873/m.193421 type:complete len:88 (+) Transcript_69873:237-500(+)